MKNIIIDYTQAMDLLNNLSREVENFEENRDKFNKKLEGKKFYPDVGCGRACIYLGDYIDAVMEMDDFGFSQITKVWETISRMVFLSVGIPNWQILQKRIPRNGKRIKQKKFKAKP